MEGSNLANCCLQAWRSFITEAVNDRKAQAAHAAEALRHPADASAQTDDHDLALTSQGAAGAVDAPPAFVAAGAPPTVPGGVLKALSGEEVWLDLGSGAITGAALWLAQKPPKASRSFIRTFDICLPWSEACAPGDCEASSTTTVDPATVLAPPGTFLRAESLIFPSSPAHSRSGMLSRSRVTSPANSRHSSSRSPMRSPRKSPARSPAMSLSRSPAASRASLLLDPGADADDVTASQVLQRISGLMSEMTAMEASLGNLKEELDFTGTLEGEGAESSTVAASRQEAAAAAHTAALRTSLEGAGSLPRQAPQRLRHRLPESLMHKEVRSARATPSRSHGNTAPMRRNSSAACGARRNALSRISVAQRGRPPFQAALSTAGGRLCMTSEGARVVT